MQNPEFVEYGPDKRYGVPFGEGRESLLTLKLSFNSEDQIIEGILRLGWSNGCPVARELTGPNSPYGAEYMLRRYSETNYWFREAVSLARKHNRAVFDLLSRPRMRLPDEEVGKHEPLSVPRSHLWRISPMSSLEGYATSRVLIGVKSQHFLLLDSKAYAVLIDCLAVAGDEPWHFLAILSEKAVHSTFEPEIILHHVYPQGILEEQNCRTTYLNIARSLEMKAPTIWRALINLPQSQREDLAIAKIPYTS